MEEDESPSPQNLFEINTLEGIFVPVRNAPRVKYTCFDVSKNLLVLGATSGSLYAFRRANLEFLRVIPNKEGPVNVISIDGNEQHIAFATRGTVIVLEHNLDHDGEGGRPQTHSSGKAAPRRVQISREHQGAVVTALQWSTSSACLFAGDDRGTVTAINIAGNKAQTLFQLPSSTIVRLTSRIVQLDFLRDKLLISTLAGCYLCDTSKEQYSQIGSKPRQGEFGACFSWRATTTNRKIAIVYATRPGSRLWEADFDGNVLYTHQLKNALARPMEPLVSVKQAFEPTSRNKGTPQSLNFEKVLAIGENNLLTWFESRLFILDTSSMSVSLSVDLCEPIADVRLAGCAEVYVRHSESPQLRWLRLLPVELGLHQLLVDSRWRLCGMACAFYDSLVASLAARRWLPKSALQELESHLRLEGGSDELAERVSGLVLRLESDDVNDGCSADSTDSPELRKHYRLESGIYVVNMPGDKNQIMSKEWRLLAKQNADQWSVWSNDAQRRPTSPSSSSSSSDRRSEERFKRAARVEDPMMYLPYSSTASCDMDANPIGYLALASMKPNVSLGEIKNSLSSTYKSGKKRIFDTMGKLEGHLKVMGTEDSVEPLDVQNHAYATMTDSHARFGVHVHVGGKQESIIYPNYEEKAITRHTEQNIQPDLEPFLEASGEAWDSLQNPKILCDAARMKAVLERWVDVLHATQESWYRALALHDSRSKDHLAASDSFENYPNDFDTEQLMSPEGITMALQISLEDQLGTVEDQTTSSSSSSDGCKNHFDQLGKFSLEDVLWWQDMAQLTGRNESSRSSKIKSECRLCSPRFFAGTASWKLASPQKETVTQLVSMCVKTKTFGRIAHYCESHRVWTRIDCLDDAQAADSVIGCRSPLMAVNMEDVVLDRARALFIRQYFGLIRPDAVFHDVRLDSCWSGDTWRCILNGILATSSSGVSSSNLARGLHCDLRLINPFLSILRSDTRDASTIVKRLLEVNDKVYSRDVLYLDQTMKCQDGLFLRYMDRIYGKMDKKPQKETTNQKRGDVHCEDALVEAAWVQLMLQDEPNLDALASKCPACDKAKPISRAISWKWQDQLVSVFVKCTSENGPLFLELCEEYGFWLGKFHLLHHLGSRQEMFKHFVQLGHAGLLQDSINSHLLPETEQEWEFVFRLVIDREEAKAECIECNKRPWMGKTPESKYISLEDVAWLMLRQCDARCVIAMLQKLLGSRPMANTLSLSFYRSCILSAAIKQQQSSDVAHSILKKTDAFVWSKRAHYASREVRALLVEKEDGASSEMSDVGTSSRSRLSEDSQCHWGVRLDLASYCHVCFLPLGLLSADDGVRIYPCGHGYHKRCAITEQSCVACVQSSNFRSRLNSNQDLSVQNSS